MDTSNITPIIFQTINNILENFISSIDTTIFGVLDDLVFINENILKKSFFEQILGQSSHSGLILIANSLLISFIIYYCVRLLYCNYISRPIENPSHFILKFKLNNMHDPLNNISTFSIFSINNQDSKNNENIENNMELEENQENKENSKIDEIKIEENDKEEESKKEQKEKRRVRGPNRCYRIIEDFFKDKKRAKIINSNNEETSNNEDEDKKIKRKIKSVNMIEVFDEFLSYAESKVNENYYNTFIIPIITNYKEYYIEKEKEFKENKNSVLINNIDDENLIRKKKTYGLENTLEIAEILNEFMKVIYNKNIFKSDNEKIEMIEIIFIFCAWLKQNHYSSYNIEYLIKPEDK